MFRNTYDSDNTVCECCEESMPPLCGEGHSARSAIGEWRMLLRDSPSLPPLPNGPDELLTRRHPPPHSLAAGPAAPG